MNIKLQQVPKKTSNYMGFRYFRPSPSSHSLSVHGDLHVWSALEALTILLEELSELLHLKPVPTKSMACRNLCSTVDHNRSYIMLSHLLGYTWILIFLILHIPKCSKLFCCFARGRGLLPFSAKDKALRSPRGTRVFRREATVGKVIESLCSKSCHCRLPYHGPSIMLVNNGWQWLIMATVIMIDSSVNLPEAHSPQRSPESLWLVHKWTATDPVLAAPCASTAHRSLVYPHWIPCRKWGFQSPQDMTLEPQQPSFCQACPSLYFQNLTFTLSSLYHLCIIFVSSLYHVTLLPGAESPCDSFLSWRHLPSHVPSPGTRWSSFGLHPTYPPAKMLEESISFSIQIWWIHRWYI